MSIARNRTRIKPSPTRKTVVLFDSTMPRRVPGFGRGLDDEPRMSITDLVAAWEMAQDDDYDWDEDELLEIRAAEFAALDALERGLIPRDMAERLSRSSVVGHMP